MKSYRFFYYGCCVVLLYSQALLAAWNQPSCASTGTPVQPEAQKEIMLQVGEELEYSVHYSLFNIGKLLFRVTDKEVRNGKVIFHASVIMDSNPSLSWLVDLHIRFYSEIDQDAFSYGWVSEDSTSKKITYRTMKFDYDNHKMYFTWGEKLPNGERKQQGADTVAITKDCQDGLSLFYHAREHVLEKMQKEIATFIDTNEVKTKINFGVEHLEEEIDAVDYPIDVVKLDGRAEFEGVFGLTGDFEGVFSNDVAGIPITARLKVILGSVRVELKRWSRGNWIPPKSTMED